MADELNQEPAGLAGLNYSSPRASEIYTPQAEVEVNRQRFVTEVQEAEKEADPYTWGEAFSDITSETLTGTLYNNATAPRFDADPGFSEARFMERFKAAQAELPQEWWHELEGAESEAEFDYLLNRSKEHIAAQTRLNNAGWGTFSANLLANILDPASLAIGFGVMAPAVKLGKAARLSRNAALAADAAAGGASGAAMVGAYDAAGQAPSGYEYAFATGLGMVLGGAFGPISKNAKLADEARIMVEEGERQMAAAQKAMDDLQVANQKPIPNDHALVLYEPPAPAATGTRHEFRPTEAPRPVSKSLSDIDPERALEIQIEANRLQVEDAKLALKTMKRGSPEAEEIRLAGVAANKQLSVLQRQLEEFRTNGTAPPRMEIPEDAAEIVDDLANSPEGALMRQRIDQAMEALRNTEDEGVRAELESFLDGAQGFHLGNEVLDIDDATLLRVRQATEMRLKGATQRGDAAAIELLQGRLADIDEVLGDASPIAYGSTPEAQAAGAAAADVVQPSFIDSNVVLSIKNEDVATPAFGKARYDRSSWTSRSKNAFVRLISNKLMNNAVGMSDHSTNARPVDLDIDRTYRVYLRPYYQALKVEARKYADAMGWNTWERVSRRDEFFEHVGLHMRGKALPEDLPPSAQEAVTNLGKTIDTVHDFILQDMQNPLRHEGKVTAPLPAADLVKDTGRYLWRRYDPQKVFDKTKQIGTNGMKRLFKVAIAKAQPQIKEEYLDRLAEGFSKNIIDRAHGLGDEWSVALTNGDRRRFMHYLRSDTTLSDAEIDEVAAIIFDKDPRPKTGFAHLKRRVLLDETHVDQASGVGITDLLDNNVDRLLSTYARRTAGRVALARMQIEAPLIPRGDGTFRGGDVIIDGVRTDAEIADLFNHMRQWAADEANRTGDMAIIEQTKRDIKKLEFAFDRLMGVPDEASHTKPAQFMRGLRDYNFFRLMWQAGFAQLGETGTMVGTLGVKAAFSHAPAFRRVIDVANGRSRMANALFDELEAMGIGIDRLHGLALNPQEHVGELPFTRNSASKWDRMSEKLSFATRFTNEWSGMAFIQQVQERHTAAAVAQKIANMAAKVKDGGKLSRGELNRMKQLGLSPEMLDRVFKNFEKVTFTDGFVFRGRKIARLNMREWEPDVRVHFEDALFRMTRKLVQSGDLGNTALWMNSELAKTFFQFRNFTFTAYANNLLYNVHMRDRAAIMSMIWSTGWAAMVRGVQISAIASLRPDGDRYRERYLTPYELAKAGFSRSGYASISPMAIDTLLLMTGQPGVFDARSTGQVSSIMGSPSITLAENIRQGVGGIMGSAIDQRMISQAEVKSLVSSLPGATIVPWAAAMAHLVKDLPERAPKEKPVW